MRLAAIIISTCLLASPPATFAADVPDLRTRADGSDWPHFLGPAGDSTSPETGIRTKWDNSGLPIKWQRELGEGYAPPVTSKGRLFVFDRVRDENRLVCLNAETGAELWEFRYPTDFEDMLGYSGGPRCCPVVDDDRVYILGGEGVLHCLDVVTGKVKWKLDTRATFNVVKNFFGVGATPVIEGEKLILQVGGSPADENATDVYAAQGRIKSNNTAVVALNKHTGEVIYKTGDDLASYASPVITTIGDRRWAFVFARKGLLAFNPADGKVDFHYPWRADKLESVNASNPVVVGSEVLISECYDVGAALLKVKPAGHDVVWNDEDKRSRLKSLMTHWCTPIHVDGYVYASSGRHSGGAELRCVEWKTGDIKWSVPKLGRCTLTKIDGHFVVLSEFGGLMLVKINPEKPEPVTALELKDDEGKELIKYPAWAPPIVSHGLMYVKGKDRLVCLELIPPKK